MKITRYAVTQKARNTAKYGADAPIDYYINSWSENVEEPESEDEWDSLFASIDAEKTACEEEIARLRCGLTA